jgi:hypothetical protein
MGILDSQGRLFGKVSILDLGAAIVILMVVVGIFLFPGTGRSVAQINANAKPVEVDLMVRGLNVTNAPDLINKFQTDKKTKIIIRNQPHGEIDIKSVKQLPRTVAVPQPDGSVKALPDPRPEIFSIDMLMTLAGKAQVTQDGVIMGNSKIKIGTSVELEGIEYNFNATVIGVRIN